MIHHGRPVSALVLLTCFMLSGTAGAQVLEEITVTAQKREQDLSDVGISITALSGKQLKDLGLTNTAQLDDQVPGLMIHGLRQWCNDPVHHPRFKPAGFRRPP